jgi:spore maturation protein CgeB
MQYGEGCEFHGSTHVPDILDHVSRGSEMGIPNVIIMENQKNMQKYTGMSSVSCYKILYLGDYLPDCRGNIEQYNKLVNKNKIDLVLCPVHEVMRLFYQEQMKETVRAETTAQILPYSVDTDIYKPRPHLPKVYDVMAVFGLVSYVYPQRPTVQKAIATMPNVKSLIGDWSSKLRWYDYARGISQSKIFVSVNGVNNQITMKYTEAMASGSLLLTNVPRDFARMGFEVGKHCVSWATLPELKDKIRYYIEHEEEREEIASVGRRFVRDNYSTKVMAKKLITGIRNATNYTDHDKQRIEIRRNNYSN